MKQVSIVVVLNLYCVTLAYIVNGVQYRGGTKNTSDSS
jgi:hypothetical protein